MMRPYNLNGPCELNALHRDILLAVLVRHQNCHDGRRAFPLACTQATAIYLIAQNELYLRKF